MNQEPVAWMQTFEDGEDKRMSLDFERIGINDIPLYTAPRELSDEEITEVAISISRQFFYSVTTNDLRNFVEAILKKASEK